MEKVLFDGLVTSLKQATDISKGRAKASRRFTLAPPKAKEVREKVGLSQIQFAQFMRVSVKTLQNWEQARRTPTGPASTLLHLVSRSPQLVAQSLH